MRNPPFLPGDCIQERAGGETVGVDELGVVVLGAAWAEAGDESTTNATRVMTSVAAAVASIIFFVLAVIVVLGRVAGLSEYLEDFQDCSLIDAQSLESVHTMEWSLLRRIARSQPECYKRRCARRHRITHLACGGPKLSLPSSCEFRLLSQYLCPGP